MHIPQIDDETLEKLRARIKPLVRVRDGAIDALLRMWRYDTSEAGPKELFFLEPGHGRHGFQERPRAAQATGLREVARTTILVLHTSMFHVSEAEVLAQLPAAFADDIVAYEVCRDGQVPLEHSGMKSFFVATAVFYAQE